MNVRRVVWLIVLPILTILAIEMLVIDSRYKSAPHAHPPKDHPRPKVPLAVESSDDAARQIFEFIYAKSHSYEYGGVILKFEGGVYIPTDPDTQLRGDAVNFNDEAEQFPGAMIAASYHTHPCTRETYGSAFSDFDIDSMRRSKTPGYMLDLCTGAIHYWAPGDALDPPIFGIDAQLATGKIVGHIKVDGVVLQ